MSYSVGQIVYLLSEKSLKVIPVQIVEEIVRNTLDGRQVTYMISMPNKERSVISLGDVNAKIFTNSEELESFMVTNAKKSISSLLNEALRIQEIFVGASVVPEESIKEIDSPRKRGRPKKQTKKNVQTKEEKSKIKVDLGNGIKANVSVEDLDQLGINP